MASKTEIAQQALIRLGHTEDISDINENKTAARLCRVFIDSCMEQLLRTLAPGWARKRAALALVASKPTNWAFAYVLPADCLRALRVLTPGARTLRPDVQPAWEILGIGGVRHVCTDVQEAELEYVANVTDLNRWDPLSRSALGYLLASEVALGLTGKPDAAQTMRNGYSWALSLAGAGVKNESHTGAMPEPEFIEARNA